MTLTPTEIDFVIRRYAALHGRNWRAQLRQAWESGTYKPGDDWERLSWIRERMGVRWLGEWRG